MVLISNILHSWEFTRLKKAVINFPYDISDLRSNMSGCRLEINPIIDPLQVHVANRCGTSIKIVFKLILAYMAWELEYLYLA